MRFAGDTLLSAGAEAIRATAGALIGWPGDLFSADGETFSATMTIDGDARVPGSVRVLQPGSAHPAVVQVLVKLDAAVQATDKVLGVLLCSLAGLAWLYVYVRMYVKIDR